MKTVKLDGQPSYPRCGKDADGATGQEGTPRDGDLSVCLYCAGYNVYRVDSSGGFQLEPLTEEARRELPLRTQIKLVGYRKLINRLREAN